MFGLGIPEIILILVVALLLFGAKRLPELGKSLGRTLTEFKKGVRDISSVVEISAPEADKQPPPKEAGKS